MSKFEDEKQLDKKETCMVEVWKDELMETVTEEMQEIVGVFATQRRVVIRPSISSI